MLRRLLPLVAVAIAAIALVPTTAAANFDDKTQRGPEHQMVFPVVGPVSYSDTYGAPRSGGRTHAGQDIMASKMQHLVAAASGRISWITVPEASYGYMLTITGDNGWKYHYVHINNDTPGTDDGQAQLSDVFAPGITKGARVEAGQHVAYVGDSGNAESTPPHLHFELVDPSGATVNPMAALDAATRLPASRTATAAEPSPFPRLAGADRVATAIAMSKAGWAAGAAAEAVIADGTSYAEALPASVLAAKLGGPLLLVTGTTMPDPVVEELKRLGTKKVTTIGSVATGVDDRARQLGLAVARLGVAHDRLRTAVDIAKAVGNGGGAVAVNADSFADGISAAALAAGRGWPILLVTRDYAPQVTVDAWRALGTPKVTAVGGTAVIGDKVAAFFGATRLAGADRYATSTAVAARAIELGRSLQTLFVATGTAFPDALGAGPLAARRTAVTVLVDGAGGGGDRATRDWLAARRASVGDVTILGGPAAVGSTADRALQTALAR